MRDFRNLRLAVQKKVIYSLRLRIRTFITEYICRLTLIRLGVNVWFHISRDRNNNTALPCKKNDHLLASQIFINGLDLASIRLSVYILIIRARPHANIIPLMERIPMPSGIGRRPNIVEMRITAGTKPISKDLIKGKEGWERCQGRTMAW